MRRTASLLSVVDLSLGLGLILGGAVLLSTAKRLPAGFAFDPLGPGGFPTLLALGLITSGSALAVQSIVQRPSTAREGPQATEEAAQVPGGPAAALRLVGAIGSTAAYLAVFEAMGFLVSTPVYLASLLVLQGGAPPRVFLLTTAAFPLAVFAVFQVLGVTLPLGILESLWYHLLYGGAP
jgi:hypothetical protein